MVAKDYRLVGIPFVYYLPDLIYILGAEIVISKNFAQILFRIDSYVISQVRIFVPVLRIVDLGILMVPSLRAFG